MENSNTRGLEQKSDKHGTTEEYIPQAATDCISATRDSKARETTTTRNRRVVDSAEDRRSQKRETLGKEKYRGEGDRRGQGLRVLLIHFPHSIVRDVSVFVLFYLMIWWNPAKLYEIKGSHPKGERKETTGAGFFFVANFRHLVTKRKGLANPTTEFLRIKFFFCHILRRKS